MRRLRRTAVIAALGAAVLAGSGTPASAAPAGKLVPASGRLAGLTGGELLGEEASQTFQLPASQNPWFGNGSSCYGAGPNQKVLILWTRPAGSGAACTVKPGTPVFLFTYLADCSSVEKPPFFAATAAEPRARALDYLATSASPTAILVTVDGMTTDVRSSRYLAVSPQRSIILPSRPNPLGAPAGPATFVAAGWVVMLRPLAPGSHTITVESRYLDGVSVSEATVDVVPGWKG